jgi:hypothetical protein
MLGNISCGNPRLCTHGIGALLTETSKSF